MDLIEGYTQFECIRKSRRSAVYVALDRKDNTKVRVKYIDQQGLTKSAIEYVLDQCHEFKKLNHKGFINILSVEKLSSPSLNGIGIICEDLKTMISIKDMTGDKRLDLEYFFQFASQFLDAINHLHENNLVLKTINPSMIFVDPAQKTLKIDLTETIMHHRLVLSENFDNDMTDDESISHVLPYISPERTGRTNLASDYRSDFYQAGVIFYEWLTGKPPFTATDPIEIIYAHLARNPVPPHKVWNDIPEMLSKLILKLLAKNPSERYQSGYGIMADFNHCQLQLNAKGAISAFALGNKDVPEKLTISDRLFGRQTELKILLGAFDSVSKAESKVLMIAGPSGIGKSSLKTRIQKTVVEAGGFFGYGRFEKRNRNIPYSAIILAFKDVFDIILKESSTKISQWREKILSALGEHSRLIVNIIPELEYIIGTPQVISEIASTEVKNCFPRICEKFIQVFAQAPHPFVIFLDDLHWADPDSLNLIGNLFSESSIKYSLFIGAYRQNELDLNQELKNVLEYIEQAGIEVQKINVGPLDIICIRQMIIDSISKNVSRLDSLVEIISQKTHGIPVLIVQLLRYMVDHQILFFNYQDGMWQWEESKLGSKELILSIDEQIQAEITRLPPAIQQLLQIAACIGTYFDLKVLCELVDNAVPEVSMKLLQAIESGLVSARETSFQKLDLLLSGAFISSKNNQDKQSQLQDIHLKFVNENVRNAFYRLLPADKRQKVHMTLGQSRLLNSTPDQIDKNLFQIVNHLNYGLSSGLDTQRKIEYARLNLLAGQKAKSSAAYSLAVNYLKNGIGLLDAQNWENHYDIAFALYKEKMECEYLNRNFEQADELFNILVSKARSNVDRAMIYNLKMVMLAGAAQHERAVEIGLTGLTFLKVNVTSSTNAYSIVKNLIRTRIKLAKYDEADLLNLPVTSDPQQILVMEMLMNISFSAYLCNPYLLIAIAFTIIDLTIKYGNTHATVMGFVIYGAALCAVFENYASGNTFAEIGMKIDHLLGESNLKAKILLYYGNGVCLWKHHVVKCLEVIENGIRTAKSAGDFNYAGYHIQSYLIFQFAGGVALDEVLDNCNQYLEFMNRSKDRGAIHYLISLKQTIKCLRGETLHRTSLDDRSFFEKEHMQSLIKDDIKIILLRHYMLKMRLYYIMGEYKEAIKSADLCKKLLKYHMGTIIVAEYYFFYTLILAAMYEKASIAQKIKFKRIMTYNHYKIKKMARHCPQNFLHKDLLIQAEKFRLKGNTQKAMSCYQSAIYSANENGFQNIEAVAYERVGKLFHELDLGSIAKTYFNLALTTYDKWGAKAKSTLLNEQYPDYFDGNETESFRRIPLSIDMATVVKSLQIISTEIVFEKLLKKLMQIVMERAGAQRAFFISDKNDKLEINASSTIDTSFKVTILNSPLESRTDLLISAVNYVKRTRQCVVLNNAATHKDFCFDAYAVEYQPKSILCLPIVYQNQSLAILYLENNLTVGAFTPDHIEVIQLLAAQAAISFEHAMLYDRLTRKEKDLRELSEKLRSLSSELLLTEERQRRRIAVELHDRIGHALTNIKLNLGLLKDATAGPDYEKGFEKINKLIDQSISDTQSLTFELSPPVLYDLGLDAAIEWLVCETEEQHGLEIDYRSESIPQPIEESLKILLFQIARELIFNIVKHAQARIVQIRLKLVKSMLQLHIQDDGIGFYKDKAVSYSQKGGGFGLFSIQERLKHQSGDMVIHSEPGNGTLIVVSLPLKNETNPLERQTL